MFFLSGFALSDFAFQQADGTPFTVGAGENGPFALPGGVGATATLSPTAQPVELLVNDDDAIQEDAFLETGELSTLAQDITIDGTVIPAGTVVEAEFFFTTDDTPPVEFIFVSLGGVGSNDGDLQVVLTTAPIQPGDTLTFVASTDAPEIPDSVIVCFARGTRIDTPAGEIAIEDLTNSDEVLCADGKAREIRWIGNRKIGPAELARHPHLRPIRIMAGALGPDLPHRDLLVSPQHRILLSDWRAELMFGSSEVLVPAKALVNDQTILVEPAGEEVDYFHMLFDSHEIVLSEGVPSESFHPGVEALNALEAASRDEVLALFPELESQGLDAFGPTARPVIRSFEFSAMRRLRDRA